MASQPMKLSILIGADASGAKAGGAEAEAALTGVKTAANDAGAAINRLIAEQTGLNKALASTDARGDDIAAYGRQLDALRARFNPTYAAVSRYRAEITAIRDAHRVGAISTNEMTAAIGRERQATLASIDALKGRNTALRSLPAANNNFNTANIAAQFQDIGVSIAGGMSPLQIALQQGTQLSSVFAGLRASGVGLGASLLSAFGQLISPISLVTIGVIAAGAAAVQYFSSSSTAAQSLDQVLDTHAENIKALADAYGIAEEGLRSYTDAERAVAEAKTRESAVAVDAQQLQAARDLRAKFGSFVTPGRGTGAFFQLAPDFAQFKPAFDDLDQGLRTGQVNAERFVETVKRIGEANPAVEKFAQQILAAADNNLKLNAEAEKSRNLLALIAGASQRGFLVSDEKQRQAAAEALTDTYLREKAAIDEIYKAGVTSRGVLVTNAEQLLKLEQAITEEYQKQRTAITSRGFQITDKQSMIDRENSLTETYLRQQDALKTLRDNQAAFEAQRLQAGARSPQERVDAARAAAAAQVITGEDPDVRTQRIDLAGKLAQINAERELQRAQEDRARSLQASVDAQRFELSIIGLSAAEQQRLRMEYQLTAQVKEQAARAGVQVDQQELALIRQKAAEYAKLASAVAGQNALKSQTDDIDRLRLEISLVGASADVRARSLAAYEAEKQIRDAGIQSISREADAIRANAQVRADLQLQLERQQAAYQSVQQAGSTMIDQLVVGTGTLKDRLKAMAETLLTTFQQLAIANPLKNMLFGTNLPTFSDLISGKSASPIAATTTGAMTVTAGTVLINGVPLNGLSTPLGTPLNPANNNVPAAANQNLGPFSSSVDGVNALRSASTVPATSVEAYIRQAALARGIDPNVAVAVAKSEGGLNSWNQQSLVPTGNGTFEQSYGPYQLYMGGGLGNRFQAQTGLDPRLAENGPAGVDFALDTASKEGWGAWYGARKAGISDWEGIGPKPAIDQSTTNSITQTTNSIQKLGQTTNTVTGNLDQFGNGALDASKALTSGSSSITGSVTQLSTATAQVPAQSQGFFSSLFSALGQGVSGIGGGISSIFSSIFGGLFASGGVFMGGNVQPFATGGVVTKPTLFPMSGGRAGLMGEAGPEAIMPLARGSGGRLGVAMVMPKQMRQGGGSFNMNYRTESTIVVTGNGDRELQERFKRGQQEELDRRDRQIRAQIPGWIEEWGENRWARYSG